MGTNVSGDNIRCCVLLDGRRSIVLLVAFMASLLLSSCAGLPGADPVLEAKKALERCDPFMGDYHGKWKLADESESGPLAAQVIVLAEGMYRVNLLAEFDTRRPPMLILEGRREGSVLRLTGRGGQNDAAQIEVQAAIGGGTFSGTLRGDVVGSFTMVRVVRLSSTLGAEPPADAIVLFNGKDFREWEPANKKPGTDSVRWKRVRGRAMEVKKDTGSIVTKREFTDFKLHLEFRTPFMPDKSGQARGNSGVYLQGRYEVQILDSYGLEGKDNECGGIYKVGPPLVNMCSPPMQWQTYDITFSAPRFDGAGAKTQDASATTVHNGVTIHDKIEIPKPTGGALDADIAKPGGILLQDHGNAVQFRNIWVVEL
ncbi:MAG: DUF1080 domain-containing protein [Phycisphaerales bacterium]|nr:MAG: DUF1080 domain-containing protein [Phycisphaerales bacterium]